MRNNTATQKMANDFGTTIENIFAKQKTESKKIIQDFKKGDIVVCFAGHPYKVMCIVELATDNCDIDNFNDCITGKSYLPLTSHLISSQWFKIN